MSTMQAIQVSQENGKADALELTTVPIPDLTSSYDILVKVHGCALNPVDIKSRSTKGKILGYDGAGVVEKAGDQALFKSGDEVFYAGVINRNGTNAQYHVVDSRIVGPKPKTVDWAEAASYPLVALTAWEMLEGHFGLETGKVHKEDQTLLIVNGAGGVGSIAIQLAKKVFGIRNIIATASRPDTVDWVKKFGATHVINHHEDLGPQIEMLGLTPNLAFICYDADKYIPQIIPLMRAWGKIGTIIPALKPLDFGRSAFGKAISLHYELMFARGISGYDLETQGRILAQVSQLIDQGELESIATQREVFGTAALRAAHEHIESGKAIGKITFSVPTQLQ